MFIKRVLIIASFIPSIIFAQLEQKACETGIRINQFELFHEFGLQFNGKKIHHRFGIGYGINKTLFQRRFSPEVHYSLVYTLLNKPKWQIESQISTYFSFYKVNKLTNQHLFFTEFLAGFCFSYGEKHVVFIKPEIGKIIHTIELDHEYTHFLLNTYQCKIGYAFRF